MEKNKNNPVYKDWVQSQAKRKNVFFKIMSVSSNFKYLLFLLQKGLLQADFVYYSFDLTLITFSLLIKMGFSYLYDNDLQLSQLFNRTFCVSMVSKYYYNRYRVAIMYRGNNFRQIY